MTPVILRDLISRTSQVGNSFTSFRSSHSPEHKMTLFKKLISAAAVVACLALPQKADADGSAELMAGNRSATLDLKVGTELAPRLQFFTRQLPSVNYNNEVSHFGLISLGYNVWDGLNVLAQAQAIPGVGFASRFGLEYFKQVGDFGLYGEAVSTAQESPQIELLANVGYKPQLTEYLHLVADLEVVTLLSPERGYDYSTQKLRLGLGAAKFEFGPAVNVEEVAGNIDYNVGGSVKVNF